MVSHGIHDGEIARRETRTCFGYEVNAGEFTLYWEMDEEDQCQIRIGIMNTDYDLFLGEMVMSAFDNDHTFVESHKLENDRKHHPWCETWYQNLLNILGRWHNSSSCRMADISMTYQVIGLLAQAMVKYKATLEDAP